MSAILPPVSLPGVCIHIVRVSFCPLSHHPSWLCFLALHSLRIWFSLYFELPALNLCFEWTLGFLNLELCVPNLPATQPSDVWKLIWPPNRNLESFKDAGVNQLTPASCLWCYLCHKELGKKYSHWRKIGRLDVMVCVFKIAQKAGFPASAEQANVWKSVNFLSALKWWHLLESTAVSEQTTTT